jgi:putative anti-sigma factor
MQLTAKGDGSMQMQKKWGIGRWVSACRENMEGFLPGRLLGRNHVLRQANRAEVSNFPYLCSVFRTRMRCLSWFYNSKIINTSQLTEKLKVKAASMKINAKGIAITKKSLTLLRKILQQKPLNHCLRYGGE